MNLLTFNRVNINIALFNKVRHKNYFLLLRFKKYIWNKNFYSELYTKEY